MIEQKVPKLNRYFEEQIAMCNQRSKKLLDDERTDEAAFEKVKATSMTFSALFFPLRLKPAKEIPMRCGASLSRRPSKFSQAG